MSVAFMTTLMPVRGQRQSYTALCLPLDFLPGWLFNIGPTRVKPEYRERIQRYRAKCYRVLWKAFLQGELFPNEPAIAPVSSEVAISPLSERAVSNVTEQITSLTEQIDILTSIIGFLREHRAALLEEASAQMVLVVDAARDVLLGRADHLEAQMHYAITLLEQLVGHQAVTEAQVAKIDERTKRLTPAHARNVQGMVEHIVETHKRQYPRGPELTHMHIYGRLKTKFRAGKFDEIPDERYSEVEAFLRDILRRVTSGQEPEQGSLF